MRDPEKTHGTEIFRPYARLISVLGDQLITSKWVGVIELVKNCYDADANHVYVRFLNFDLPGEAPVIEIEDDGDGMTIDIVLDVWMKPATPHKLNLKRSSTRRFTKLGRMMQGDKGIGRFAIYKLGNEVDLYTKTTASQEAMVHLDFREYARSDEFADDDAPERFLDQVRNKWRINATPKRIKGPKGKGTLIRISDLRNDWTRDDLKDLALAFQKMIPPVIPNFKANIVRDFDVELSWNGDTYPNRALDFESIISLAPFGFEGAISTTGVLTYIYRHNTRETIGELDFFAESEPNTHDVWGLRLFKDQFLERTKHDSLGKVRVLRRDGLQERGTRKNWRVRRMPEVGDCHFYFYAFNLRNMLDLDSAQQAFIKDNSVYLYRDFTRVYPYGEKGIDWLMLSKLRSDDRAGFYFSYNDLLGFVFISQENNPKLRDAANREGLVNIDGAYYDFVALIQAALKVMKDYVDVDKKKDELKKERATISLSSQFTAAFQSLQRRLEKNNDPKTLDAAQHFFTITNQLIELYKDKLSLTQELAGVGMAVEKSSHDIFILINKLIQNAETIVSKFEKGKLSPPSLRTFLLDLSDNLEFLYQEVQILQPLFRVARKTTRMVSIMDILDRVQRYYQKDLRNKITFVVEGEDFQVKTNLGLMLQVFLNLTDNAIYWLTHSNVKKATIKVIVDDRRRQVVYADNGPGIDNNVSDIVFSEFYSTKADGRGLGLYIIRELLSRIDADISVIMDDSSKALPGANFLLTFSEVA